MRIDVQLFAGARDQLGRGSVQLELSDNATVADLRHRLATDFPVLADIMQRAMLAVDAEYASDNQKLHSASEIALIPPVSGG